MTPTPPTDKERKTLMRMPPILRTSVVTAFFIAYIILSIDVMSVYFPANGFGQTWGTRWEDNHDVREQPLAYRLLIPNLVYLARTYAPITLRVTVRPYLIAFRDDPFERNWLGMQGIPSTLEDNRIVNTALYLLVVYCSLLAFLAMLYALARALFPDSLSYALLAPVLALLTIVPISKHLAYYYDFSSMFFTCACLLLLLRRHWKSYVICFLLAVYNEETALLITVFYFMYFYSSLPRRQYIRLGVLQVVLGVGLEALIRYFTMHDVFLYAMNGSTLWMDGEKGRLWWVENALAWRAHDLTDLMHALLLGVLITYHWMEKPEFLRAGCWMVLANTVLFFAICFPKEYRDLYASMPILILMASHSLVRMSGADTFQFLKPKTYIKSNNHTGITV